MATLILFTFYSPKKKNEKKSQNLEKRETVKCGERGENRGNMVALVAFLLVADPASSGRCQCMANTARSKCLTVKKNLEALEAQLWIESGKGF